MILNKNKKFYAINFVLHLMYGCVFWSCAAYGLSQSDIVGGVAGGGVTGRGDMDVLRHSANRNKYILHPRLHEKQQMVTRNIILLVCCCTGSICFMVGLVDWCLYCVLNDPQNLIGLARHSA
jgi:hypothetical protein